MRTLANTGPVSGAETTVYSREYLIFLPLGALPIAVGLFFILLTLFWPASGPASPPLI